MSKPQNPQAFPVANELGILYHEGMSLRDYFAAKAMQSILGNPNWADANGKVKDFGKVEISLNEVARQSFVMADTMLAEREKEPT